MNTDSFGDLWEREDRTEYGVVSVWVNGSLSKDWPLDVWFMSQHTSQNMCLPKNWSFA